MYQAIPEFDKSLINYCEEYIHRAAQFLAMLGKNYVEQQEDDSNANVGFETKSSRLLSREVAGDKPFSLALNVPDWKLEILVNGKVNDEIPLTGNKKEDLFNWLRDQIIQRGLNGEQLKYIDHYDVPDHLIDHGHAFPEVIPTTVDKWIIMRANAQVLLEDLNKLVGIKSEIRIWPHHFDTGIYYPLGDQQAIGAGWAIADTLCDNPYLYIYAWDGNGTIDYSGVPELEHGKWIITDGWQGAVLESTELVTVEKQFEAAKSFLKATSKFLKDQLK